jgi:hypothetical protein
MVEASVAEGDNAEVGATVSRIETDAPGVA